MNQDYYIAQLNTFGDEGHQLLVSETGSVEFLTDGLAEILLDGVDGIGKNIHFDTLLAQPFPSLGEWSYLIGKTVDVTFIAYNKIPLYLRGCVCKKGRYWLFNLIDISDCIMEMENKKKELDLLHDINSFNLLYKRNTFEGRLGVVEDMFDKIISRFNADFIGVLIKTEDLSRYKFVVERGVASTDFYLPDDGRISGLIGGSNSSAFIYEDEHGFYEGRRLELFVPYIKEHRVHGWLFISFNKSKYKSWLSFSEWESLANLIVSPALDIYECENNSRDFEHNAFAKNVFGSGLWRYKVSENKVSFSKALASKINIYEGDLGEFISKIYLADKEIFQLKLNELVLSDKGSATDVTVRIKGEQQVFWYKVYMKLSDEYVLGYMQDVTLTQEAQLDKVVFKQRLTHLVSNGPAIIYVKKYIEGAFVQDFLSQSVIKVLGWTPEEVKEEGWLSLMHREDRYLFEQSIKDLITKGSISYQYRLRDRYDQYHWILDEGTLLRDDAGLPLEVVGVLLDNTERKNAEAAMRVSEERYRVLVEDAPTAICRYTPDLQITYANQPLLKYLNVDSLVGSKSLINLSDYLTDLDKSKLLEKMSLLSIDQPMFSMELCFYLSDYESGVWLWSVRGLFDNENNLIELQAIGRDDTELHHSRQDVYQHAKMATIGRLSAGIAHELNQPLNIMRATLTNIALRIERNLFDEDYIKDKVKRMGAQVTRAAKIIDSMHVFGYKNFKQNISFIPEQVVTKTIDLFYQGCDEKVQSVGFENFFDGSLVGDGDLLEQVLLNLLINARYAHYSNDVSSESDLKIFIKIYQEGNCVLIEVQDNSGGVPEAILDKVFDPFFTTKPVGSGTGLGLSLCYEIVNQFQGRLSVVNRDKGACFTIQLPIL